MIKIELDSYYDISRIQTAIKTHMIHCGTNNYMKRIYDKLEEQRITNENFDIMEFKLPKGAYIISDKEYEKEIEDIKFLISYMIMKHASNDDIFCAIRYSSILIPCKKLNLDWKTAKIVFNIDYLNIKYRGE